MKVKIISDSTCDLSKELLEAYDIAIAPLTVTLGERSGCDGTDITPNDIYEYVERSGMLPKSSAVSVGEYEALFRNWRNQGFEIVHINISSKFSASWQNACLAAEAIGGVFPVDSGNLSTGQGLIAIRAAELAREGMEAPDIAEACRKMVPQVEASFVVDSIDYLRKGGRCSALSAWSAGLLHIKPCIEVVNGGMKPGKKYHGSIAHVIRNYVEDRLKDRQDIDQKRIFITHTRCDPGIVNTVREEIRAYAPEIGEIHETTAGATITTHCGPNTLGILFVRKESSI